MKPEDHETLLTLIAALIADIQAKTFWVEASRNYDEVMEIWGMF